IVPIPRAQPEIAGLLNLRGQIVTVLCLRRRLGLPDPPAGRPSMNVIIRHAGETFSLLVDEVGDVIDVSQQRILPAPYTLDALWKSLVRGVYRLESRLFIVLNISAVLKLN